ncbi:bacitracin resistance protein [Microbacterium sp. X-17]|uniref:bacitracin resistance protein n=1 Tax=Microbacterium sp. X-17 TaxID=3144404 RepID=UPI0031F530DB
MTTNAERTPEPARRTALPVWAIATISGVFALFYAYAFWNALSFLFQQVSGGLGINGYGWFVLLLAAAFPVIVFAIAFAIGWRRKAFPFALILFTGLCVACVFWLNVLAYTQVAGASLLGT